MIQNSCGYSNCQAATPVNLPSPVVSGSVTTNNTEARSQQGARPLILQRIIHITPTAFVWQTDKLSQSKKARKGVIIYFINFNTSQKLFFLTEIYVFVQFIYFFCFFLHYHSSRVINAKLCAS